MHDFVIDRCELTEDSIRHVELYTKYISHASDFSSSEENSMKLDAAMMRLQSIGENIKKIYKLKPDFFEKISYDPDNIIRFRDFISHHYEKLDTDIVFEICKNDIPVLKQKINSFLSNNNETV